MSSGLQPRSKITNDDEEEREKVEKGETQCTHYCYLILSGD